jgi:hypothetical protein
MNRTCRFIGFTILIALFSAATRADADFPPPQQFRPASNGTGKSAAALVIQANNTRENPQGEKQSFTSEFDTKAYCYVVLDIEAGAGASGILKVTGAAVPLGGASASPEVNEIAPIRLVAAQSLIKSVAVPMRHDATFFEWEPAKDSNGSVDVWATAFPCGLPVPN